MSFWNLYIRNVYVPAKKSRLSTAWFIVYRLKSRSSMTNGISFSRWLYPLFAIIETIFDYGNFFKLQAIIYDHVEKSLINCLDIFPRSQWDENRKIANPKRLSMCQNKGYNNIIVIALGTVAPTDVSGKKTHSYSPVAYSVYVHDKFRNNKLI